MLKFNKKNSRGQSLVETAIVLPILLLIIMGIIEFGLLFNNYIIITNASREGARKAAIGGTDSEIIQVVENITTTLELSKMTISVSPSFSSRRHGTQVQVEVVYRAGLITPIIGKFFPGGEARLMSTSVMRVE
ncbi:MAG: pilus assembly protein [Clostridiaceae bacterium]|jgi:Flp pilus assembly protein TadG|nr:pilus assembly protein [Clostridiaceae bacterium]